MNRGGFAILQALLIATNWAIGSDGRAQSLHVSPAAVHLDNPEATQQILVSNANRTTDLTHIVSYTILDAKIASVVNAAGLLQPVAEGKTTLVVRHDKNEARIPVEVTGLKTPTPVSFATQVMPILSRAGCNGGGCHGKAEGKNGFKLSIFGFDPAGGLRRRSRGDARPPRLPRGAREQPDAPQGDRPNRPRRRPTHDRRQLALSTSAPLDHRRRRGPTPNRIRDSRRIEVEPREQIMTFDGVQQLRVTAIDAAGKKRCVTLDAEYDSNAPTIAKVDGRGHPCGRDVPARRPFSSAIWTT